jgi:hypothetical protein
MPILPGGVRLAIQRQSFSGDQARAIASHKAVRIDRHARRRGWERRSPVRFAREAVARQLDQVRRVCPRPGDRAAVDYREGIAVVERLADGRMEIRTILEKWMFVDDLPVVPDYVKNDTTSGESQDLSRQRHSTWSIASILSAHDHAKLRAVGR